MDITNNGTPIAIPPPVFASPPNQFALLDLFIPGFSTFTTLLSTTLGLDLNIYIPSIVLAFATYWALHKAWDTAYRLLRSHFMTSAEIRIDDEMYNYVMGWIAVQPFSSRSKRFVAQSNTNSKSWYLWYADRHSDKKDDEDDESELEKDADGLPLPRKKKEKPIHYTPGMGTHVFWYKYRPYLFHRYMPNKTRYESPSEAEEISISALGRDPSGLKELLAECRALGCKADSDKTLIYRGSSKPGSSGSEFSWTRSLSRVARPMSSVVMDESMKRDVLEDVAEYLAPRTRRWYANRGIPYRRGYLLYGAPGTGKSSLSLALAGRFALAIYIVSLNSPMMNEENLASLFAELPSRCVVLLEDIDTAGLTHTRDEGIGEKVAVTSKSKGGKQKMVLKDEPKGKISLSALLNVLDGVASQEGRVLIMTTNHVDKLDEALIRPGRVDMKIEFKLADRAMMAALFRSIYIKVEGDDAKIPAKKVAEMKMSGYTNGMSSTSILGKKEAIKSKEEIAEEEEAARKKIEEEKEAARIKLLAEDFADVVSHDEFSPAEVQGYLLKNKREPERAIRGAAQWVVDTRVEKRKREEKEAKERREKEEREKKEKREKEEKEEQERVEEKKKKPTNGVNKEETSSKDD